MILNSIEFPQADVSKPDNRAVAEKAEMAFFVQQSRMIAAVYRSVAGGRFDIGVDEGNAVETDFHPVSLDRDLMAVPFADRPQVTPRGRHHSVDGPVILVRPKIASNPSACSRSVSRLKSSSRSIVRMNKFRNWRGVLWA